MDCHDPERLDETIQAMLTAGPVEALPSGFGRKVKVRVTLAAMLDWERQRWRYLSGAGLAGLIVLSVCLAALAAFPQLVEWVLSRLVPGGAGYADYVISQAWYGGYRLALIVSLAGLAAMAALAYFIQRVRSWSPMGRS